LISSSVALALGRPELNTTSDIQYWLGACLGCMANSSSSGFVQWWLSSGKGTHYLTSYLLNARSRFGVQSYFGSQLLGVLLRCVFGNSWWHMANHLPESAGISSRDLLAFFLFWMIEMPFLTVHPSKIKFLFAVS
jgi:hypothetical protein